VLLDLDRRVGLVGFQERDLLVLAARKRTTSSDRRTTLCGRSLVLLALSHLLR
jgi:hypothetical protein